MMNVETMPSVSDCYGIAGGSRETYIPAMSIYRFTSLESESAARALL